MLGGLFEDVGFVDSCCSALGCGGGGRGGNEGGGNCWPTTPPSCGIGGWFGLGGPTAPPRGEASPGGHAPAMVGVGNSDVDAME